MQRSDRICLGRIDGPHGVRGLVRVRPFTEDPGAIASYGPLTDASGRRRFALTLLSWHRTAWLARVDGVEDRDAAAALRGESLYVPRSALPDPGEEGEAFYHADLIGLRVDRVDGRPLGRVRAVHDFGAGDLLDLSLDGGGSVTVPFTKAVVPTVDLRAGRLVVDLPAELEPADDPA